MKIARYKKASKTINFYKHNFGFRDPYQVLIDATFCQLALQHQINIQDQLPKYLQAELRLVTTQCIIVEAEGLGGGVSGATQIVKQFLVHKCGHDQKPIAGADCMKVCVCYLGAFPSNPFNATISFALPAGHVQTEQLHHCDAGP